MDIKRSFASLLLAVAATLGLAGAAVSQELVQNGDFSNNTYGVTTFNIDNAGMDANIAFCTGFGDAQEIDLAYGAGWGPQPLTGNTKLGLHRQAPGAIDAFSTTLLAPVVAGRRYRLQYDVTGGGVGLQTSLQIGVSNNAMAFGTLFDDEVGLANWTRVDAVFIAPANGGYLTFRPDPAIPDGYVFVTNVSLMPVSANVASVTALPRDIRDGGRSEITVTLDRVSPAGGTPVAITLSARALVAPTSVIVPAGRRFVKFNVFGLNPSAVDRRVDLTASIGRSARTTSILVRKR
ncbi:MAG: hypothetical protein K1X67_05760 [Fimbriimonadaceae bacterium]|nr:hypothetical protein [Fimbriimonadaceae bacterium]